MGDAYESVQKSITSMGQAGSESLERMLGVRTQGFIKRSEALMNGFSEEVEGFGKLFLDTFQAGLRPLEGFLGLLQGMPEPLKVAAGAIIQFQLGLKNTFGAVKALAAGVVQITASLHCHSVDNRTCVGRISNYHVLPHPIQRPEDYAPSNTRSLILAWCGYTERG
jgi:hypothetical protein